MNFGIKLRDYIKYLMQSLLNCISSHGGEGSFTGTVNNIMTFLGFLCTCEKISDGFKCFRNVSMLLIPYTNRLPDCGKVIKLIPRNTLVKFRKELTSKWNHHRESFRGCGLPTYSWCRWDLFYGHVIKFHCQKVKEGQEIAMKTNGITLEIVKCWCSCKEDKENWSAL